MRAEERRQQIIERLYQRRQDTVANLAHEFGVCVRTIHYDIEALSLNHPIETVRGRHGGGVRIMDGCRSDRKYLTSSEQETLESLCSVLEGGKLADIQSILRKFSIPRQSFFEGRIFMTARPLYELAAGFNAIFDLVLDDTMDLTLLEEGLQSIECELEEKCANGIALIKSLETYAEAYTREEKRFQSQRQSLENRIRRIKDWYRQNLDAMRKTKVPTRYGVMSVQGNGGKRPLAIDDESQIPEAYLVTVPEHKEVDRDALYNALDRGDEIPGAHLEPRGRGLRIR